MMNLSPMGCGFGGNSSSSSSNLSALAPPFTVDRLNPNFNSSPLLHYSDSPYMTEHFNHAWPYPRPSAPGPELVSHSVGETGVHLSDGYRFSASASIGPSSKHWSAPSPGTEASGSAFAYGGEIKPYYSSYVPPLIEEDGLIPNQGPQYNFVPAAGTSHTSQLDYPPSSFDLECEPRWIDNLGFDDGKRAKRVEVDRSFLSDKVNVGGSSNCNQIERGGYNTGTWNKSNEGFDFAYQKFNQGYDTEFHTGDLNAGHMEAKHPVKDFCLFSDDSKLSNILESSSIYQESHPSILPHEMHNISNYTYTPFDKCIRPDCQAFVDSSSILRSSPTVVIRPPSVTNVNLGQSTLNHKPTHDNNGEDAHIWDFDHHNPEKDFGTGSSFKINEHYPETNLVYFSKRGNGLIPSTSVEEQSSALHSSRTFADKINTRCIPQLSALTVPCGLAVGCGNVQTSNSADVTSDVADTHNLGVDSPCWKGAPYSKISQFDVESGNIKKVEKIFSEYNGFDQQENQTLHPIVGFDIVSSKKTGQGSKNNHGEPARMDGALKLERTVDAPCASNEQSLLDTVQISTTTNSKGVKMGTDMNMMRNDSSPPNSLTGVDMKDCNTKQLVDEDGVGMTPIYASEDGDVAVHAAEKVLDSPASQDAADEHPKRSDPKLNVSTMIKGMVNLSELLLFQLSNHELSLDGPSTGTLKYIVSNLDSCLGKKFIQASDRPESNKPVGDTSENLGESCNVGATSESCATNEVVNSKIKLGCGIMHDEVETLSFSGQCGKKDKKFPNLSPCMGDLDITGDDDDDDDDAAEAIKMILEDNFHFDEEMHSQALLFKRLWLEAEAKLCSISYKARFDRMKMLMEETKLKAPQASKVPPKAHDSTYTKSTVQDYSFSCTADDIEASVMERFNILKSRDEDTKPVSVEAGQQPEMVVSKHAPSAVARFKVLKSSEGNAKSSNAEEERETDMVGGEHETSFMARFNILKSHEGNSKLSSVEEEQEPEMDGSLGCELAPSVKMRFNILKSRESKSETVGEGEGQSEAVNGDFLGGKYATRGLSEKEILNVAPMPDFQYQIGRLRLDEDKFGSCVDEFHLSVKNGPIIHPFNGGNIISQESRDSSSDWEHVLKDEFAWKNL